MAVRPYTKHFLSILLYPFPNPQVEELRFREVTYPVSERPVCLNLTSRTAEAVVSKRNPALRVNQKYRDYSLLNGVENNEANTKGTIFNINTECK